MQYFQSSLKDTHYHSFSYLIVAILLHGRRLASDLFGQTQGVSSTDRRGWLPCDLEKLSLSQHRTPAHGDRRAARTHDPHDREPPTEPVIERPSPLRPQRKGSACRPKAKQPRCESRGRWRTSPRAKRSVLSFACGRNVRAPVPSSKESGGTSAGGSEAFAAGGETSAGGGEAFAGSGEAFAASGGLSAAGGEGPARVKDLPVRAGESPTSHAKRTVAAAKESVGRTRNGGRLKPDSAGHLWRRRATKRGFRAAISILDDDYTPSINGSQGQILTIHAVAKAGRAPE